MGVAWETPGGTENEFHPIFRAPKSGSTYFILLGPAEGVKAHWVSRTVPCTGKGCIYCKDPSPRKFMGYFPTVRLERRPELGILELTEAPTYSIRDQEPGTLIRVGRNNLAIVARVIRAEDRPADFPAWMADVLARPLPECFDVRAALLRIWRLPPEPAVVREEGTIPLRRQA